MRILSITAAALLLLMSPKYDAVAQDMTDGYSRDEFRDAMRLYDDSMYSRSRRLFDDISEEALSSDPEGLSVLSQVRMGVPGYDDAMDSFIARNPHSMLVPQIRWHHAMNLFDKQNYREAGMLSRRSS